MSFAPVSYVSALPPLVPERDFASLASLHEVLMTTLVFALLKYGKGKERAAFNNLGNGSSPQDRETVSGQSAANKSFGRASGRKVKASIPGSSSMPTGSGNNPSTSSHLTPGPRPGTQLSPPRNSRTSADTITYEPLSPSHPAFCSCCLA